MAARSTTARRGTRTAIVMIVLAAGVGAMALGLTVAASGSEAQQRIGNHTFVGRWAFGADGVIEQNGVPGRSFWEAATFVVDGRGHMTGGVEYSNLISDDEAVINQPATFEGTYHVRPNATGTATVDVTLPNGAVIRKSVWFVLSKIHDGEAYAFVGGHTHADLGDGVDGNAGLHFGQRVR